MQWRAERLAREGDKGVLAECFVTNRLYIMLETDGAEAVYCHGKWQKRFVDSI